MSKPTGEITAAKEYITDVTIEFWHFFSLRKQFHPVFYLGITYDG